MKFTLTVLALVSFFCLFAMSQNPGAVPAGMRHSQELQVQNEASFPSAAVRSSANPNRLRMEADELARLAASVPADIHNVNKGLLSKDLIEKLKHIEKMSKHLRTSLAH